MAYVRRKGNQLALVLGVRDPETRQVEQRTLFSFYSKAEVLAAVGKERQHFRQMMEQDHPGIRFDWSKIEAGLRGNLDHLPELYGYSRARVESSFREALRAFARELMLADPQLLLSSARVLQANRHELAYLADLIAWRLKLCDQPRSEWNQDNPFYWRSLSYRREVPAEEWEKLATFYQRAEFDEAEALARLLTECWPNFAEGFNYLGLIALERGDLDVAVGHFDEALRVGRTLFPKRIRKDMYWTDDATRPYIRAMIHKAGALNRMEKYGEALLLCDRLEKECAQDIPAALERAAIYLNSGLWKPAVEAARYAHVLYPAQSFPLAFGCFEDHEPHEALVHFLYGALRLPRTARMLAGQSRLKRPKDSDEVRDHNTGVNLLRDLAPYLRSQSREAKRFFRGIVQSAAVRGLMDEMQETRHRWRSERGDRRWFERMTQMESIAFARQQAAELAGMVGVNPDPRPDPSAL